MDIRTDPPLVPRIATVGVYGFDGNTFLERLSAADVRLVLDVRQRRGVRRSAAPWGQHPKPSDCDAADRPPGPSLVSPSGEDDLAELPAGGEPLVGGGCLGHREGRLDRYAHRAGRQQRKDVTLDRSRRGRLVLQ